MLVPRLIKALLTDSAMTAALDAITIPVPDHTFGSGVPGCTEWPEHWTADEVAERSRIPAMQHGWRRVRQTYAYYNEFDGIWTYIVTRGAKDAAPQYVMAFPVSWGRGAKYNRPNSDLLSETVDRMFKILDAEMQYPTVAWPGERMHHCGHRAEGTMWLLEAADVYEVAFAEDIYIDLYLMALRGMFDTARPDAEDIVAAAWSKAYPATWGLTPASQSDWTYRFRSSETMSAQLVVANAKALLHNMFNDSWPFTAFTAIRFESTSAHLFVARYGDKPAFRATRTWLPDDDDPFGLADDGYNNHWDLEFPTDPRAKLAGAVLAAALILFDMAPDGEQLESTDVVRSRFLLRDVAEALVEIETTGVVAQTRSL